MKFVFDLDGTICFDGNTMPQPIRQTLREAVALGHEVIFASARSYRDCLGILGEDFRHHLVIGLNGGLAYHEEQLVYQEQLDEAVLHQALILCERYDLPYFLDNQFDYAYQHGHRVPFFHQVDPLAVAQERLIHDLPHPIKMVIVFDGQEELVKTCQSALAQVGRSAMFYHENEKCLYLNPTDVTKGATVEKLCGPDFIAFGNDKNDLELFDRASYAVQVGDYEPLKSVADCQVEADPESVAQVIRDFLEVQTIPSECH